MNKYIISLVLAFVFGVSFTACSGGGGSSADATGSVVTYDLTNFGTRNDYSIDSNVTLSANSGDKFTFSLSLTKQGAYILNGVETTEFLELSTMTNVATGVVTSGNVNYYYNSDGRKIQSVDNDNGVICRLDNEPTKFSSRTKIGDSGIGSSMSCSDGTRHTKVWALIKVGSDVVLEEVVNSYNLTNVATTIYTTRYTINTLGDITIVSGVIRFLENGLTLTIEPSVYTIL